MGKLPPPAVLQPIVTEITEWMAALACGQDAPPPRYWSSTEWRYARAIAHIQGIAPLLHVRGAARFGDGAWRDFLGQQYERNGQRNARVLDLVAQLRAAASQSRVPLVLLKGASLITWLYDDIALRPMSDIDALTRSDMLTKAGQVVESVGYVPIDKVTRHTAYILPPNSVVDVRGEHPDNPIKLELHPHLSHTLPRQPLDITALYHTALQEMCVAPGQAWVGEFIHLLQHASFHAMTRALRLIGLYDLHLYTLQLREDDWREVEATLRRLDGLWWAYPPLALCQRYFGNVPDPVLTATEQVAPAHLRTFISRATITQMSYCNLAPRYGMHAARWARTPWESMLYLVDIALARGSFREAARHKTPTAVHLNAPRHSYYRRGLRWFNPHAYRVGIERAFGE
jgi:hypothetical protein